MKVSIERLIVEVAPGERVHPATLKAEIERKLARRISEREPRPVAATSKTLTSGRLGGTETQRARAIAGRIYEGIGR